LRRALTRRAIQTGVAVLNRGEPEIAFGIYHPGCELVLDRVFPGLPQRTCGRDARIRFQQQWNAEWGDFWFEPEELVSFGDNRSLLILGRVKGTGRSSGAGADGEWGALFTLKSGGSSRSGHSSTMQRPSTPPGFRNSACTKAG
jgi:hypothetical protein